MKENQERAWKTGLRMAGTWLLTSALAISVVGGCLRGVRIEKKSDAQESRLTADSAYYLPSLALSPTDVYRRAQMQTVFLSWEEKNEDGEVTGVISGAGIILSRDGYILTNAHCVSDAKAAGDTVSVELHDGTAYDGVIVGADTDTDVALVKIEASNLSAATVGAYEYLEPCQTVYVMGHPGPELKYTMTSGIISALDRSVTFSDGTTLKMFQLDAPVNPGNSGGPVFNEQGYVIGVTTAKYVNVTTEGIGFAIPMEDAVSIAGELKEHGYVRNRPLMGITVQNILAGELAEDSPAGARVYSVEPGLCGEAAGLLENDIIIGLDDTEITSMQDLLDAKKAYHAFDTVTLKVWRGGEVLELELTFDEVTPEHPTGSTVIVPEIDPDPESAPEEPDESEEPEDVPEAELLPPGGDVGFPEN